MEVSSHIEVKILDRNTGWEAIAPPGRSIVTVPAAVGRGGDFRLFVRCPLGECAPPPLAGAWEQLELLIAAMRLDFDSLGQESVAHYRTTLEAAKVEEFESILRQILTNWRDWRDRVERGHPVFESKQKICNASAIALVRSQASWMKSELLITANGSMYALSLSSWHLGVNI